MFKISFFIFNVINAKDCLCFLSIQSWLKSQVQWKCLLYGKIKLFCREDSRCSGTGPIKPMNHCNFTTLDSSARQICLTVTFLIMHSTKCQIKSFDFFNLPTIPPCEKGGGKEERTMLDTLIVVNYIFSCAINNFTWHIDLLFRTYELDQHTLLFNNHMCKCHHNQSLRFSACLMPNFKAFFFFFCRHYIFCPIVFKALKNWVIFQLLTQPLIQEWAVISTRKQTPTHIFRMFPHIPRLDVILLLVVNI